MLHCAFGSVCLAEKFCIAKHNQTQMHFGAGRHKQSTKFKTLSVTLPRNATTTKNVESNKQAAIKYLVCSTTRYTK